MLSEHLSSLRVFDVESEEEGCKCYNVFRKEDNPNDFFSKIEKVDFFEKWYCWVIRCSSYSRPLLLLPFWSCIEERWKAEISVLAARLAKILTKLNNTINCGPSIIQQIILLHFLLEKPLDRHRRIATPQSQVDKRCTSVKRPTSLLFNDCG